MHAPVPAPSALVGRDRELDILGRQLGDAIAGRGSLVLISGEAGIGKSALAEAVCHEAAERGALVLVGRCYDLTETPPYGPWVELFGHYQPDNAGPPLPNAFATRGAVGGVASQAVLFQQVGDFLGATARTRPAVLLLDDLQWADPASLDLLRVVARDLAAHAVLVVATYRSDEITRRHPLDRLLPLLVREAPAARIALQPLRLADIAALVQGHYILPSEETDRLVAYLDARSEGNPFFLGELLLTLEDEQVLRWSSAGWKLGDVSGARVPTLLRQVIDARLARLGDEARSLLAVAAVIGHEVPLRVWQGATDGDEEALGSAIERAIAAHLMDATDGGARFAHALIREALYESIAPPRRHTMHRRVGEVLAASPDAEPDAVADHFRRAGDARAAEWLLKAADGAQRAYAWLTAADRLDAVLALMPTQGSAAARGWLLFRLAGLCAAADVARSVAALDDALRAAGEAGDRALAAAIRFLHGYNRFWTGDMRASIADMEAGVVALAALPAADRERLDAMLASGVYTENFIRQGTLAAHLSHVGRLAEALALAEPLAAEAERAADADRAGDVPYADVYTTLGHVYADLARPAEAQQAFARSRRAFERMGHLWQAGLIAYRELERVTLPYRADALAERENIATVIVAAWERAGGTQPGIPPQGGRMPLLYVEGRWEEARRLGDPTITTRRVAYQQYRVTMGHLLRARGEVEQAWVLVRAIMPDGPGTEPGGSMFRHSLAAQYLAAALSLDAGDHAAAKEWLQARDAWLDWSGTVYGRSEGQALWAQYYRQTGDQGRAYTRAERALTHAADPRQPLALMAAYRLLGELDTDRGRFDDAAGHLDESLRLADACAAPYERALILLAMAEWRAGAGEPEGARRLLEEMRAICEALGAKPSLARADALAARLAASKRPAYPAGLTAREVEVLRLVAAGRTSREIAEALFLSITTINNHVAHILTKTDATNRTEAAVFAQRHNLV